MSEKLRNRREDSGSRVESIEKQAEEMAVAHEKAAESRMEESRRFSHYTEFSKEFVVTAEKHLEKAEYIRENPEVAVEFANLQASRIGGAERRRNLLQSGLGHTRMYMNEGKRSRSVEDRIEEILSDHPIFR